MPHQRSQKRYEEKYQSYKQRQNIILNSSYHDRELGETVAWKNTKYVEGINPESGEVLMDCKGRGSFQK